jgi:hypothetical protein
MVPFAAFSSHTVPTFSPAVPPVSQFIFLVVLSVSPIGSTLMNAKHTFETSERPWFCLLAYSRVFFVSFPSCPAYKEVFFSSLDDTSNFVFENVEALRVPEGR